MTDQPKPTKGECSCDDSASDVIINQHCPQHGSLQPTTGDPRENDPMADKDFSLTNHPTTGEWTPVFVSQLFEANFQGDTVKAVADAHNAELSAEKENGKAAWRRVVTLEQQLDAEREKVQTLVDALERISNSTAEYASTYKEKANLALAKVKEGK